MLTGLPPESQVTRIAGSLPVHLGKHLGFLESVSEVFPDAKWQRCAVHFFRNVFTKVPCNKFAAVASLFKATYAQEDHEATLAKIKDV